MIEAWSEEGQCPLVFGLADEDADVPFSGVFLSVVSRSECGSEDSHQFLLTPCQECPMGDVLHEQLGVLSFVYTVSQPGVEDFCYAACFFDSFL